jgi:hypothetical protein
MGAVTIQQAKNGIEPQRKIVKKIYIYVLSFKT